MWVIVLLGIAYFLTRLPNLTLLPVFADEAIYIHWSQVIWHDATNRFIPLSDGKPPLFMWLMVPFLKVISEPLLAGRSLSVLSGLMTLIGVFLLSRKLFSQKVAILAAILVILQPFLLFYDRLALVDSMLTAFGVWAFYGALLLFEKPDIGKGILLGTVWGGAMLTKPSGGFYPLLTPPFLLLFSVKTWFAKIKKLLAPAFLASGYGLGFYNVLRLSGAFHMITSRSADYLRSKNELLTNPFQFIPNTSKVMLEWLASYFSWLGMVFLAVVVGMVIVKRSKKAALLLLWVLFPFFLEAAIGKIVYPRYLLVTVPFILILISWGLVELVAWSGGKRWLKVGVGFLGLIVLGFWSLFDWRLLTDPGKAPLHQAEKEQYLQEWAAGYGIREVADYLRSLPKDREVVVATEGYFGTLPNGLQIYLSGFDNLKVYGVGQPIYHFPDELSQARDKQIEAYLVVNDTRMQMENRSALELVAEYPKPAGPKGQQKLQFYRVLPKSQ